MRPLHDKSYDVIIIGAGVIGAGIAYHLSMCGIKNILVVESAPNAGSGSTSKATGGFRAQFGSQINIKLSQLSRRKLLAFNDEHGIDPCYQQAGYLFLARSNEEMKNLTLANSLQQNTGVKDAMLVTVDEVAKLNPHISRDNIIGGSYCQSDGFISPLNILQGYINSSVKNGVKFLYDTKVTGIKTTPERITEIETTHGSLYGNIIVNAAGAYAASIAKMAGEELPVKASKRQVCRIKEPGTLPPQTPMTIWVDSAFHFRMRDGHLILLHPCEPENNENYNTEPEEKWMNNVFRMAKEKLPALSNCSIDKAASWAGLYEISPDEHLILGRSVGLENLYYANGSSGHGVMHSPAIGELLANIICGKENEFDVGILSPARFAQNKLIEQIPFF